MKSNRTGSICTGTTVKFNWPNVNDGPKDTKRQLKPMKIIQNSTKWIPLDPTCLASAFLCISKMLARAKNAKPRRNTGGAENSCRSVSFSEYDDFVVGFTEDLPLISTDGSTEKNPCSESLLTLRQVLRSSVGVIGESCLGLTEKVVLLDGKICALKRFRNVRIRRREFGRRIVRLAMVTSQCQYLVPINAYFYAKRIKFVVCEYYPMGSLADLLASARKLGQTPLNWNQRLKIVLGVAEAIEFIHTRCFSQEKHLKMNVHGNIKASNVMINIDFTACLSNYGFVQLAEPVEVSDTGQRKLPASQVEDFEYSETYSQQSDIYNFGIIVLDILRGPQGSGQKKTGVETREKFKDIEEDDFFEFAVEGTERMQAWQVLDIGWACLDKSPEARPTIEKILRCLAELF